MSDDTEAREYVRNLFGLTDSTEDPEAQPDLSQGNVAPKEGRTAAPRDIDGGMRSFTARLFGRPD